MLKTILYNWNFARLFRLGLGLFALAQGIVQTEWLAGIAGVLLVAMAVANKGCCGTSGCTIPAQGAWPNNTEMKD